MAVELVERLGNLFVECGELGVKVPKGIRAEAMILDYGGLVYCFDDKDIARVGLRMSRKGFKFNPAEICLESGVMKLTMADRGWVLRINTSQSYRRVEIGEGGQVYWSSWLQDARGRGYWRGIGDFARDNKDEFLEGLVNYLQIGARKVIANPQFMRYTSTSFKGLLLGTEGFPRSWN